MTESRPPNCSNAADRKSRNTAAPSSRAPSKRSTQERDGSFLLRAGTDTFRSRRILLATGLRAVTPEYVGFLELYGGCAHHCPDCDGYEVRDKRVAVHAVGQRAMSLVEALRTWTTRLTVVTDGCSAEFSP